MWYSMFFSMRFAWSLIWRLVCVFLLITLVQERLVHVISFFFDLSPMLHTLVNTVLLSVLVFLSFVVCVYWMLVRGVMSRLVLRYAAFESRHNERSGSNFFSRWGASLFFVFRKWIRIREGNQ